MEFVVPARFCGPPESGNGGWVSGRLVAYADLDGAASVRSSSPPPLEKVMQLQRDGESTVLLDEAVRIAQAGPAETITDDPGPEPVSYAEALAAGTLPGPDRPPVSHLLLLRHAARPGRRPVPAPRAGGRQRLRCGLGAARGHQRDRLVRAGLPGRLGSRCRRATDGAGHDDHADQRAARSGRRVRGDVLAYRWRGAQAHCRHRAVLRWPAARPGPLGVARGRPGEGPAGLIRLTGPHRTRVGTPFPHRNHSARRFECAKGVRMSAGQVSSRSSSAYVPSTSPVRVRTYRVAGRVRSISIMLRYMVSTGSAPGAAWRRSASW